MSAPKIKSKTIYIDKDGNKENKKVIWIKPIEWIENENGCYICTSHKVDRGYSRIVQNGIITQVHRYIYEECFGFIPEGLVVRHKCDNRRCINPEHLELGTHQDNMNDMAKRGRSAHGSKHPFSKLNEEDVINIKRKNKNGISACKLAKEYNVSKKLILNILHNKVWRHVK